MSILGYEPIKFEVVPSESELILDELIEINNKLNAIMNGEITDDQNKLYYLWDKFYSTYDDSECYYLNYYPGDGSYRLSTKRETSVIKTKFTDSDIEHLNIPIERFQKIEVK